MPLSNYIISKQEKKSRENINLKLTLLRIGESLVSSITLGISVWFFGFRVHNRWKLFLVISQLRWSDIFTK